MKIQELWNESNDYVIEKVNNIYESVMEEIKIQLINFQSIFEDDFYFHEKRIDAIPKVVNILKEKLSQDEYIFELTTGKDYIHIKVYLLEKTEEQYKAIEEQMETLKESVLEEIEGLNGNTATLVWLLTVIGISGIMFLIKMITPNLIIATIIAIMLIVLFIFAEIKIDKHIKSMKIEKGHKAKELKDFIFQQERIFCTKNTNIKKVEELYKQYKYNNEWKHYLDYVGETRF